MSSSHQGFDDEQREIVGGLLANATPTFVTREEFKATVNTIESKIENASLKQRNWVLGGCLAIILAFGGGYMSLVAKLDRLNEALPVITQRQNERWPWVQQLQQRELMQDEALRKLDKNYQPLPYGAPPQ